MLFRPAKLPKNELSLAVALALPANAPKKELPAPVVFAAPALNPAKRLAVPGTPNTLCPPMLYCVAALRMFAVPLPLMLKFEVVCGLVEF